MSRLDELARNLDDLERRITTACSAAGRSRRDLDLVVVTKTYPAGDVALLTGLGVTDVGENRHPEAGDKRTELLELLPEGARPPRLHFVGALQTNKAGAVARYADMVQSVDRPKLARSLSRGAESAGRELECLVQIDFGDAGGRAGVAPAEAPALADEIAGLPGLELRGVMTVAPLGADPRPIFDELMTWSARVREDHPGAGVVSAGMSNDVEQAVAAGATHLRVGRSVLGERAVLG